MTPLKKYAEISYRVKCVAVENERVFGDVYVTQQTRNLLYCADGYQFPSLYSRGKRNLIHRPWKGPDFMELNRKKQVRRASCVPDKVEEKCLKRSKSVGDAWDVMENDCKNANNVKDKSDIYRPKVSFIWINIYSLILAQRRLDPTFIIFFKIVDDLFSN